MDADEQPDTHEPDEQPDTSEPGDGEPGDGVPDADLADAAGRLRRLAGALHALDDESLQRGIVTMSESSRQDLAAQLALPRAAMHLGDALVPLFRRKALAAPPERQLGAAFSLTERVNEDTIAALGPRHEDPTREDMLDVLPAVVDAHGAPAVTLMLAAYAASDAPCADVFDALLDDDERFAVPEAPAPAGDEGTTGPGLVIAQHKDAEAQAAKREQRRAAKEAKRAAEAAQRAARQQAEQRRRDARRAARKQPG